MSLPQNKLHKYNNWNRKWLSSNDKTDEFY